MANDMLEELSLFLELLVSLRLIRELEEFSVNSIVFFLSVQLKKMSRERIEMLVFERRDMFVCLREDGACVFAYYKEN